MMLHPNLNRLLKIRYRQFHDARQERGPVSPTAIGSWVGGLRDIRLWASDECYRLFGDPPGGPAVSLRGFLRRVHPDDRRRVLAAIARGLGEPGVHEVGYRVRMADGEIVHFVNQACTFRDDGGTPVSIGGTTRPLSAFTRDNARTRRQADCLRVLMAQSTDGVAVFDRHARLQRWNARFVERSGFPAEFVHVGRRFEWLWLPLAVRGDFGAGEPTAIVAGLQSQLAAGKRVPLQRAVSGTLFELRGHALDEGGFVVFCVEVAAGLPEQEERQRLAETIIDKSPAAIVVLDGGHRIRSVNPAFSVMTGFEAAEVAGRAIHSLASGDGADMAAIAAALTQRESRQGELLLRRRAGEPLIVRVHAAWADGVSGGRSAFQVWMFADISESRRAAREMHYLAHHDPLTGLANRLALQLRLEQALPEARRRVRGLAVLFLDLDRFKIINDTLGHPVGDELLREAAARLLRAVRESDFVARLGGDEFVVVLPDINGAADAAAVAGKLLAAFAAPVLAGATELHTGASIGISLFPDDGGDADALLRNADTAMYHAKGNGRNNYQFFASEMNIAANRRLDLERNLRQALARQEFALVFQPQVCALSGRPVGIEALLRWRHPRDGMISPATFIPVAEETGLIVPIGEWVLRAACQRAKAWLDAGLPPIRMAVNVSARQLQRRDFVETVAGILAETELPPEWLELEITESVAMENPEESITQLRAIGQMGVSIAIDDFGTGYSSLAYLKRLPIDSLKIDRSFVADIEHDLNDRAIAIGTIALAHSLGLKVIAEGVETGDQLELLRANGCDEIQGYHFSPPLEAAAAFAWLGKAFAMTVP